MLDIEFGDTPEKKGNYIPEKDLPKEKEADAAAEEEKDYEGEDPEEEEDEEKSRFWFWAKLVVFLVIVLAGIGFAVWFAYPTQLLEEDVTQTEEMGTDVIPGRTGGSVLSDVEDPGTPFAGIEGREEVPEQEAPVSGNDTEGTDLQPVEETGEESEQNYGTVSYSDELTLSVSTGELSMIFQNPADSTVDMKAAVYAEGACLWQSELLKPGSGISAVKNVKTGLEPGKYPCEIRVSHYDPETEEQFAFELSIDAKLEVVK